ncbi:hypothetical protein GJ496_006157 [Pomphorhynchus laevis]|nr:hypothetical protein GJ496_006157 [Pomphorhynchus laevis]
MMVPKIIKSDVGDTTDLKIKMIEIALHAAEQHLTNKLFNYVFPAAIFAKRWTSNLYNLNGYYLQTWASIVLAETFWAMEKVEQSQKYLSTGYFSAQDVENRLTFQHRINILIASHAVLKNDKYRLLKALASAMMLLMKSNETTTYSMAIVFYLQARYHSINQRISLAIDFYERASELWIDRLLQPYTLVKNLVLQNTNIHTLESELQDLAMSEEFKIDYFERREANLIFQGISDDENIQECDHLIESSEIGQIVLWLLSMEMEYVNNANLIWHINTSGELLCKTNERFKNIRPLIAEKSNSLKYFRLVSSV